MNHYRLLWIEEETDSVLNTFKDKLTNCIEYVKIVSTASEAEELLLLEKFDLIILDLRINAGFVDKWINYHIKGERRLGLRLLEEVIALKKELLLKTIVFTHESWENVKPYFDKLGLQENRFKQKGESPTPEIFKTFVLSNLNI